MSDGEKDFSARTKNSFKFVVNYKDQAGVAINLTGYTVAMDVRKSDATLVTDLVAETPDAVSITNAANGEISVNVVPATTTNWPVETLYYDLQLTHTASGSKEVILFGKILVSAGVTD